MEQDAKTETPQSNEGDVETTIVIKKATSQEESSSPGKNCEGEGNVDVEAAVVVVKSQEEKRETGATKSAGDEDETEEVEVEEEVEVTSSESEQELTSPNESIRKQSIQGATGNQEKKEAAAQEASVVNHKENEQVEVDSVKEEKVVDTPVVTEQAVEEPIKEEANEIAKNKQEDVVNKGATAVESVTNSKQENTTPAKLPQLAEIETTVQERKQENVNNTIKEIISDIDSNILEQERVSLLKQEELKLLRKQQELAQQIQEQQLLARKLASQNDIMQQKFEQQQQQIQQQQQLYQQQQQQQPQYQQQQPHHQQHQLQRQDVQQFQTPQTTVAKYSTHEESRDGDTLTKRTESYETQESSNVTKRIDLQKIFTPATDAEEILPKNRKLYASSAFYSPSLHPTVEDQVELARRISHSLSDISNQQSKGQSMYVNRKKRSVKWVHEGQDYHPYQAPPPKPPTSPSILPAYSDAGKHRVQLNLHQEQVLEKYAKPGLKVVKSPWEAALESGSASTAFIEEGKSQQHLVPSPSPALLDTGYQPSSLTTQQIPDNQQYQTYKPSSYNDHQRDLAYKPSLAQGWKAPSVSLPKELYVPKEIPLESYAPPPTVNIKPTASYTPYNSLPSSQQHTWVPAASPAPISSPYDYSAKPSTEYYNPPKSTTEYYNPTGQGTNFPVAQKSILKNDYAAGNTNFPVSSNLPPKQQYWDPTSYQKVPATAGAQKLPQVNFNPSPLPYEKLAKFEGSENDETQRLYSPPQQRYLAPSLHTKVRNTSPAPFGTQTVSSPQQQQYFPYQGGHSPSVSSSITPTHYATNELLHGPTFNNSARGWHASSGKSSPFYTKTRTPLASVGDIPYSDF